MELEVEVEYLRRDMKRQADRVRRFEGEIRYSIGLWKEMLETGRLLSYDTIKRRISQLCGALKYPGVI